MSKKKPLDVSASSMIDFKAELFRKQDQFRIAKSQSSSSDVRNTKKPAWLVEIEPQVKKNKKKIISEVENDNSCDDQLEKSRRALEEKAKLYEVLEAQGLEDGDGESCLVDFEKKAIDSRKDDGVWVEYTDALGRTRKCLKEDYEIHQERDKELKETLSEDKREERSFEFSEQTEEEVKDIHYEDLKGSEVRSHGVGYYGFSQDAEERERQLGDLNQLRKGTEVQRTKREEILRKRKLLLDERLNKVKQRKGIASEEQPEAPEEHSGPVIEGVALDIANRVAALRAELNEGTVKGVPKREWDRGKMEPGSEYREGQRQVRAWEFAPPDSYK